MITTYNNTKISSIYRVDDVHFNTLEEAQDFIDGRKYRELEQLKEKRDTLVATINYAKDFTLPLLTKRIQFFKTCSNKELIDERKCQVKDVYGNLCTGIRCINSNKAILITNAVLNRERTDLIHYYQNSLQAEIERYRANRVELQRMKMKIDEVSKKLNTANNE